MCVRPGPVVFLFLSPAFLFPADPSSAVNRMCAWLQERIRFRVDPIMRVACAHPARSSCECHSPRPTTLATLQHACYPVKHTNEYDERDGGR